MIGDLYKINKKITEMKSYVVDLLRTGLLS